MPGHWEGDLIMGANNRSSIGTLVERTTRLIILEKMEGTTVTAAGVGFSDKLNEVPRSLHLSMTYDQGREMVNRAKITQKTGTAIYFVHQRRVGSPLSELRNGGSQRPRKSDAASQFGYGRS